MLGATPGIPIGLGTSASAAKQKVLGYVLAARHYDPGPGKQDKLQEKAGQVRCLLQGTEWDVGSPNNPIRVGLWRALRRLICDSCEPKRMSYSIMNFEDFIDQALGPCHCKEPKGLDGIVVESISNLSNDPQKGTKLVVALARIGKHVVAEDNICLSCCHPAAMALTSRGKA